MKLRKACDVPFCVRVAWHDAPRGLRVGCAISMLALACSRAPQPESRVQPALAEPERAGANATPPRASASASTAPSSQAPRVTAESSTPLGFSFRRVETTPVSSLALGKPPKIAVLAAGEALIGDRNGFSRVSVPDTKSTELFVEIFFGRDNQPRLMGTRRVSATGKVEPYYRRYKGGRFQPEPSELGPLAGPEGALYGVLGHADPEVVCRPGLFCLVKRTTGWSRAPAHAEPVRVVLAGGSAWALHRDRLERLDGGSWAPVVPERTFAEPVALFVTPDGAPWVLEAKRDAVTRLVDGRWESMASPVRGPRAIWGSAPTDLWVVGASGAARFDGTAWQDVPGVSGPLSLVAFAPPSLWLAGEAGVFEGRP